MGLRTVHVVYEIEQRLAESRRYEAIGDEYEGCQDPPRKDLEQIMKSEGLHFASRWEECPQHV